MIRADRQTLARKLDYLRKQLDLLEAYRGMPKERLLSGTEKRLAVERLLELSIQSVIDVSRLLVTLQDWRGPSDERDAFVLLAERGVLEPELGDRLARAKGFRNVLVHEYADLDPDLLHAHLRDDVGDLWEFARSLAGFLRHDGDAGM